MNAETILELLNFTNAYVIVLDKDIKIRFINISLSNKLGFEVREELIDRCWLDFIPTEIHGKIKTVHSTLLTTSKDQQHHEFVNDIVDLNGNPFKVKWVNTAINHTTNWTFSFGIPVSVSLEEVTGADLRHQFKAVIADDRVMINNLKEYVKGIPAAFNLPNTCELES